MTNLCFLLYTSNIMKNTTLLTAAGISAAALLTLGSTFAFKGGFTGQ